MRGQPQGCGPGAARVGEDVFDRVGEDVGVDVLAAAGVSLLAATDGGEGDVVGNADVGAGEGGADVVGCGDGVTDHRGGALFDRSDRLAGVADLDGGIGGGGRVALRGLG